MKKTLMFVAVALMMLVGTSGYNPEVKHAAMGAKAPELSGIEFSHNSYTLISFWKADNAQSRAMTNGYDKFINDLPNQKINFYGVNIDTDPTLFLEIVRVDGLNNQCQRNLRGSAAETARLFYDLDKGLGAVLIAPNGVIVGVNPTIEQLSNL